MISVRNLTKSYGAAVAVDRLSFDVVPGEIVGLIGPNGAGKTSTLRCLAGIHRPTSGAVMLGGHDIVRDAVAAKRLLAFVADEPHLFALASGVLTHNSKPNGLPESVTDRVRRSHEQWFHFVAQPRYRHKSTKAAFQSTFWFTVAVNVAGLAWLLAGGGATVLDGMLLGR